MVSVYNLLWVLNTKIWVPFVMRIWSLEIDDRSPTYGASAHVSILALIWFHGGSINNISGLV